MNTVKRRRALLSIIGISALAFLAISAAALPLSAGGTAPSPATTADIHRPVAPTVPSDADPNDGFTVEAVSVSTGQVLEPGQAVRIDELQAKPSRDCTPADSDGISICAGIGTPGPSGDQEGAADSADNR